MPANETTLMHFVPKCYLKKFTKDEKTIYGIRKSTGERLVSDVARICAENNIYALDSNEIEERQLVENYYNVKFEKGYNSIYNLLTDSEIFEIDSETRKKIISFVISLFFRNAFWFQGFNQFIMQNMQYAYELINQHNLEKQVFCDDQVIFDFDQISIESAKKMFKEDTRQIFIKQHIIALDILTKLRSNDDIIIRKIEDDHEFVTSDFPVIMQNQNNNPILPFDLKNSISIPLDSKHCIKLLPSESNLNENEIERRNISGGYALMQTRIINDSVFKNRRLYLLGTETGISKFEQMRVNYADAFKPPN